MDEILASIRRIISDDETPGGEDKAPEPAAPAAKVKAEESAAQPEPEPAAAEASKPEPDKSESGKKDADEKAAEKSETVSENKMADTKGGEAGDESLVGDKAQTDTASAFAKLSTAVKESSGGPSLTMPAAGRSLEDVVRELLRPILKEWLDTHLPDIVREHVEEEVARISRGSRPR